MRLGVFLALVATSAALNCNVGTLVMENGVIIHKELQKQPCAGMCSRSSVGSTAKSIVSLNCQENEVAIFRYKSEGFAECSAAETEESCLCAGELCADIKAEENLVEPPEILDMTTSPTCYVGYYARNGSTGSVILNSGITTNCGTGMACASITGTAGNTYIETYLCTTQAVCNAAIQTVNGSGPVVGDNVNMACCTDSNCLSIVKNKDITPPKTPVIGTNNIKCMQGAQFNYAPFGGIISSPCAGSCSSVSIKTTNATRPGDKNGQIWLLDLFTCDPVQVCDSVGLNNGCGNIVLNNMNSAIRGCCCNTDNCINPSANPPVYPMKSLKCWTGIYIRDTGFNAGAEMVCAGKCGRIEVPVNNTLTGKSTYVTYMSCVAYPLCQGLGIGEGDQSYNPPMEEETTITCCSSKDNCNINPYDAGNIVPNVTNTPTTNYPILCYNNIHLNGNPISTPSYSMCSGECAMASFYTVAFGQTHNTTIYTCDPVTLCKQVGITNGCTSINGTGLTACCCDGDTCFDPTRQNRANMKCYTGVYIAEDNYLNGGETLCNGWCASLSTIVNKKNTTTYWCAPVRTCRALALGMGGDNNCNSIPGGNPPLSGCCCSENDNCNIPPSLLPNVTALPVSSDPPIICYEAIWIGGVAQGNPGYRICNGNCVSMSMGINGTTNLTTLYTCDSSNSCNALGLRNGCGSVDGTVYSCCCDNDACIDPTVNRSPDKTLTCFVGIQSPVVFAGADVDCNGRCANLSSTVGGVNFNSYHCVPTSFCRGVGLDNSCNVLAIDRAITGCCCDNSYMCNAASTNLTGVIQVAPPEAPIACYSGLHINHTTWSAGSGWSTCFGDCMVLDLNTTYNNQPISAAIYTCDPTSVCSALNMTNRCHNLEKGVFGCCCSDSGCIDPTKNPPKFPRGRPIICYNGVISGYNNLSAGAEQMCDGSCASLTSSVNGVNFTVFSCVPKTICSQLGLYDTCSTLQADRAIQGCCCDNADNCNTVGFKVPTPAPREHDFPIVCFQGIFLNNQGISIAGWQSCIGDCAMIAFNTTVNRTRFEAEWYTCDPAAVCHQLNVVNRCHEVEPGVKGCCCDTDACIDPNYRPPKLPGPPITCYVGVKSATLNAKPQTVIDVGAETRCPGGMCANIWGFSGGFNVTAFFCAPTPLCKSLELDNQGKQLPGDRNVFAMCCDYEDNCNARGFGVNTSKPITPPEYPITCYSGIFVNNRLVSAGGWLTCNGDCALVSLNTTLQNGTSIAADLYTCDPSSVCRGLNMTNSCNILEPGLSGCCCDSNGCLDPTKRPPKKPQQLTCYVGFYSPSYPNVSTGAAVICNGRCASLSGLVGGVNVTAFACVDTSICRALNIDGAGTGERSNCDNGIAGDRAIRACCCDNYNYCNSNGYPLSLPAPNPNTEFPISCWNGLTLNGNYINGQSGSWSVCNGDCASVSISTSVNGMNNTLNLYTCDPTSLCTSLKTRNTCQNLEPGISACCCDTDGCINPMRNKSPGNPLTCYVGVQSTYPQFANGVGATVTCTGKCASLSAMIGGYNTTTYHCIDSGICKYQQLDNSCASLNTDDKEVRACCCDSGPACNLNQAGSSIKAPPVTPIYDPTIACYSGVWLNGNPITPNNYQACQGDCASITLNTSITVGSVTNYHSATLYTCDPSVVCRSLNISNVCNDLEPGMRGCCCDTDSCIDPNRNKSPDVQLWCYVGVLNGATNISIGDSVLCDGGRSCMSLQTTISGNSYKVYQCVQPSICSAIGYTNGCNTAMIQNTSISACCCDNSPNCNSISDSVISNPLKTNYSETPIACWSGLYLNGVALSKVGWSSCKGDCAAMQLVVNTNGMSNNATIYSCDPATVCITLGLDNNCTLGLDAIPGLTGCCCSSDGCMDGTSIVPKNRVMNCYAGIVSNYTNNPNGVMAGASVPCNGRCAYLSSTVAGYAVTAYQCIDTSICRKLGIDGTAQTLQADRAITGMCCSSGDYCNIKGTNIPLPQTPNYTEPAIACYSGLWVNGTSISSAGYTGCQGKCASISLTTTIGRVNQTATLYTCDPSTVCSDLNMINSCASPEPGITGCCCDSDACIDPNFNRYPGRQLFCFVGAYYAQNKSSVGAYASCNGGKCGSIETSINNYKSKVYFCLNQNQVEGLGVDNGCSVIRLDRDITGCVCDDKSNCNVKPDEMISPGTITVNRTDNPPIACWSGVYANGKALGSEGWIGCTGFCASVTFNTTNSTTGVTNSMALYTCDPVAACTALSLYNNCNNMDAIPGLTGCCCDSNGCIDPQKNINPSNPTNNTTNNKTLSCFVGVYNGLNNQSLGNTVVCDQGRKCMSMSTTYNNTMMKVYQCVQPSICSVIGYSSGQFCNTQNVFDKDVQACCCDDSNNCNSNGDPVYNNPINVTNSSVPIVCWSGLYLNGTAFGTGWTVCNGDCVAMQLNTTITGSPAIATLYTCDPAAVCSTLGIVNSCAPTLDSIPGLTGCCCSTDACIDANSIVPKNPPTSAPSTSASALSLFLSFVFAVVYNFHRLE